MRRTILHVRVLGFLIFSLVGGAALAQVPAPESASPHTGSETASSFSMVDYPGRFGLGLAVGNILTGVTGKLWATSAVAFQAALGEGSDGNNLRFHLDMVISLTTWRAGNGQYILPAYLGIGGVVNHNFASGQFGSDTEGGFRVPLGMAVLVSDNPVELFFEIAPEFTVRSNSSLHGKYNFYTDGSIGVRYYF